MFVLADPEVFPQRREIPDRRRQVDVYKRQPLDGLWHDPGALGARFEIISEKDDYRIYLKKKQL